VSGLAPGKPHVDFVVAGVTGLSVIPKGHCLFTLYYNRPVSARFFQALWKSLRVTLRAVWRVVVQVFHEATGALFCLFALYGALAAYRAWKFHPGAWIITFAVLYTLVMAAFGVTSFRRAKKIR
jgi:hypothetical protein